MDLETKLQHIMATRFNPTLSFDGVAMLSVCVACVFWFGSMHDTLQQHSEILRNHEQSIKAMQANEQLISQNIAVLQTLIHERTDTRKP